MEVSKNTENSFSRRSLLCGIALLTVGLSTENASAATTAVGATQVGKKIKLDLAKNKALSKVGGVVQIDLSDGSSMAIVRTSAGAKGISAINLSCTHQGVPVKEQGSGWICPAHGSQFALNGKLIKGPARTALQKYPVAFSGNSILIG